MGSRAGWFDLSREFHGPSVAQLELLGLTLCNNPGNTLSVSQYSRVSEWMMILPGWPRGTDYARWVLEISNYVIRPGAALSRLWQAGRPNISQQNNNYFSIRHSQTQPGQDSHILQTNKQSSFCFYTDSHLTTALGGWKQLRQMEIELRQEKYERAPQSFSLNYRLACETLCEVWSPWCDLGCSPDWHFSSPPAERQYSNIWRKFGLSGIERLTLASINQETS